LEKRGKVIKVNRNWVIGNTSVEETFLKLLEIPRKTVEIAIEVDMTTQETNKILYSLEVSGLAKRTVSDPPTWSLVDEKDELIKKIVTRLETMDKDALMKVLNEL